MATTKIWPIHGDIGNTINYAVNPDKTENPDFSVYDYQTLRDVMDYACDDYKTEQQFYVTALNCDEQTARADMLRIKKRYGKLGGILAFHGYQSFTPDEVTAAEAHEIGVKLAARLWGERFQVVVATHLNAHCLHNHFVLNSVSFADGKKFYASRATYLEMRKVSDELCRSRHLSVVENPKYMGRSYSEHVNDKNDLPTYRGIVRADVDEAIKRSCSYPDFIKNMEAFGYEVKLGKYIAVKASERDRFVRLKTLGEDYTEDRIKYRILENRFTVKMQTLQEPRHMKLRGKAAGIRKLSGYRALYYHYLYKMGILPKRKASVVKRVPFSMREDVMKLDRICAEARFLQANKIDTVSQLEEHKSAASQKIGFLKEKRKAMYNRLRRCPDEQAEALKKEISDLTQKIRVLKKEVKLCDGVYARSVDMAVKLRETSKQTIKEKEENENELIERRGRSGNEHDAERH